MRLEAEKYLFDIRFQKNVQQFSRPKSLKPEGIMGNSNIWQVPGGEGALQRAAGSQSCRRTADRHQARKRGRGACAD